MNSSDLLGSFARCQGVALQERDDFLGRATGYVELQRGVT